MPHAVLSADLDRIGCFLDVQSRAGAKVKKQVQVVGAVLADGQTVLAARRSVQMSLPGM